RLLHDALWCRVHVDALAAADLRALLAARWPALGVLAELLLSAAAVVAGSGGGGVGGEARALCKAAARLARFVREHALTLTARDTHLSAAVREAAWLECVDVWLGGVAEAGARATRALGLARVW